jgi:hypothetical protein
MIPAHPPARFRGTRAVRSFIAIAAVLGGLALTCTAAAQAGAATSAGPATSANPARSASLPALQPIPLNTANWSGSAGFGSRAPAWYTDPSGVVHLQGAATQTSTTGANANVIGTLPPSARPVAGLITIAHTFNGTFSELYIAPDGTIRALPASPPAVGDLSFVSLEGVTYQPAGQGNPVALNALDWQAFGNPYRAPAWYKDGSGVVHLQGAVTQLFQSGTSPNQIGTLPAGAAPAQTVYTVVPTTISTYADLAIEPNGTINLIDPRPPAVKNYFFVSLESISYRPSGAGNPVALNAANWSGSAGFGSRGPAWYKDKSGIVHLQGAVTQTSAAGSSPNQIGTLPAAAAPRGHSVYTIVHTLNGTYADLAIAPDGTLNLIDPRLPMVKDYTFVSLEGITYRR